MRLFRHAGLEEHAPYLIRGHPDVVPTKVGNHFKDWFLVFTGNPGFPALAGNDDFMKTVVYGQTLISASKQPIPNLTVSDI
jgi:hypothetical protein